MKKSGVWLVLFLCFSFKVFAAQDRYGSMKPAAWLSSRTVSADGFALISSHPVTLVGGTSYYANAVFLHQVVVSTGSPNASLIIFNSTSVPFNSVNGSSATPLMDCTSRFTFNYDQILSTGLVYNKIGTADIEILWDYLLPSFGR